MNLSATGKLHAVVKVMANIGLGAALLSLIATINTTFALVIGGLWLIRAVSGFLLGNEIAKAEDALLQQYMDKISGKTNLSVVDNDYDNDDVPPTNTHLN